LTVKGRAAEINSPDRQPVLLFLICSLAQFGASRRDRQDWVDDQMSEWKSYTNEGYEISFDPGMLVLDVGCGPGEQMQELSRQGCLAIGLDLDFHALSHCHSLGLPVLQARAEQIPIADASLDGIICKVVLPYTREDQVISEIGRLLKPGARCYLICHGAGYYLKYLLRPPSWKYRLYGLRALINTWIWVLTGRRLPGFVGDTIYQSRRRLTKYYRDNGLRVIEDARGKNFCGATVFTQQIIHKIASPTRDDR
jgi:SAM-dependent methyltransferase